MMNYLKLFLIYVYLSFFSGCEKKEIENQVVVLQDSNIKLYFKSKPSPADNDP